MLSLLIDENFSGATVRGLRLRRPDLDLLRVQDVGLSGADDPAVLEWAARSKRVLVPHDFTTMANYAYGRVEAGQPMPGVLEVNATISSRQAIDEILLFAECSLENEWEGEVVYPPL